MNKALSFKTWRKGGRHYVLKGKSKKKWIGFQATVIETLKKKFGVDFFLVIWTDRQVENDFYNIPFKEVKHLFVDKYKTIGKHPYRWTVRICENKLYMNNSNEKEINVEEYYGNLHLEKDSICKTVKKDLSDYELEVEKFEGNKKERLSSYYERKPRLRIEAIKTHGVICKVCGFNFKKSYGNHGEDYIEVHHLTPVSKLDPSKKVCPINDMTVVCSNCHRMLHRKKNETLTIDQLVHAMQKARTEL